MTKSSSSPTKEHEQEGSDTDNGYPETISGFLASGCGCFRLFCFERQRSNDGEARRLLEQEGEHKETWLVNNLKRLKEASELLAGPKWKKFVRRLSKYFNKKKRRTQFQYDPQSYDLNFDHGLDGEGDGLLLGFSSRFASHFSSNELQACL
ncbi:hypothetical protein CsSME_00007900 [Camellia sinensis var. sinensis]|uniref:Stress induced protein n=1 Tax=Camellia sinensis var. sinensis TaxID=542762 RepID=A0A4S4F3X1_CAMSN|nr:uncharacterized protein LOC114322097 [Camellia sinensis]THG23922.1 hypothetical protein TEA_002500 [Camellia sinensis var. sinensis]